MCLASEIFARKFGYQRSEFYSGVSNDQKELNQFDRHIYFPTNWRNSQIEPLRGKYPEFIRYGGLVSVPPEYLQKGYLGIYPITEQPIINEQNPYEKIRIS